MTKTQQGCSSSDFETEANKPQEEFLPTREDVLSCQFSSWYPVFSDLPFDNTLDRSNVTIKAVIIDLPESFREYLKTDGVNLPLGAAVSSCLNLENSTRHRSSWSDDSDEEDGCDENNSDDNHRQTNNKPSSIQEESSHQTDVSHPVRTWAFPELDEQIQNAIELFGSVVPKLNWSCPRDAVWMNQGSLRCSTAGDVYLLLKSSDFCSYDVFYALSEVSDSHFNCDSPERIPLQLALRKWCHLYPSQEFRCFVRDKRLVGISQRQSSQQYPHLIQYATRYQRLIEEFHREIMCQVDQRRSESTFQLPTNYVFDVYIDKKDRVWLIDINVWASRTDALLFDWSELRAAEESTLPSTDSSTASARTVMMRVVETDRQIKPDALAIYRAPIDAIHVAAEWEQFMKQCYPPSALDAQEEERQLLELRRLDQIAL